MDTEDQELASIDCRNIRNPERHERCLFSVANEDGSDPMTPISTLFTGQPGYNVKVDIDAGRYGLPFISLEVYVDKENEATKTEKYTIRWHPGVKMAGAFMIDNMKFMPLDKDEIQSISILQNCPENKKKNLHRVWVMRFTTTSARIENADQAKRDGLPKTVQDGVNRLFFGPRPNKVTIWSEYFPNATAAGDRWANCLKHQVNSHFPPFSQYQGTDGKMVCSLKDSPLIREVAKGIYCEYFKNQDGSDNKNKEPKSYHGFDLMTTWGDFAGLGVTIGMPVVRDHQYQQCQSAHMALQPHRVYVRRMPKIPGKKQLDDVYLVYVRMSSKGVIPPPKSVITLQFDNAAGNKPHIMSGERKHNWYGSVIEDADVCVQTGTHFCVWLNKPTGANVPDTRERLKDISDEKLALAHITVKVDTTAAERELLGAYKLSYPLHDVETLTKMRIAIMSDPKGITHEKRDLVTRHPERYEAYMQEVMMDCGDDEAQKDIATSLTRVDNGFQACIGGSETGKTVSIARVVIPALTQDYTVLAVGPSNMSVDTMANAFWKEMPKEYQDSKKVMRLETNGSELRSMYAVRNYGREPQSDDDLDMAPDYAETPKSDAIELAKQVLEMVRAYKENEGLLKNLVRQCQDYSQALKQFKELSN